MSRPSRRLLGSDALAPGLAGPAARAMQLGQHVIAVALIGVGVARAIAGGTPAAAAVAAGLAVLAAHAAGAFLAVSSPGPSKLAAWWLLGVAAVWGAAVWVSAEFVWLAFLLWLLAGHLLPGVWSILFAGAVYAVVVAAPLAHHGTTSYANIFGPLIGGVFAFGISRGYLELLRDAEERERLVTSLRAAQREMADLQEELSLTQRRSGEAAERARLARDLHDTIAQSLSSIRLLAHAAAGASDQETAARLRQLEGLAQDGLVDVRRIIAALTPSELDGAALPLALGRLLERVGEDDALVTELRVDDTLPTMPPAVETALLRTAQSALANVEQHSNATRVTVSLIDGDGSVRLDIVDDGVGFDPGAARSTSHTGGEGYGLTFMRQRLLELGGGLVVESAPGAGTALSAHVPLRAAEGVER